MKSSRPHNCDKNGSPYKDPNANIDWEGPKAVGLRQNHPWASPRTRRLPVYRSPRSPQWNTNVKSSSALVDRHHGRAVPPRSRSGADRSHPLSSSGPHWTFTAATWPSPALGAHMCTSVPTMKFSFPPGVFSFDIQAKARVHEALWKGHGPQQSLRTWPTQKAQWLAPGCLEMRGDIVSFPEVGQVGVPGLPFRVLCGRSIGLGNRWRPPVAVFPSRW